RTTGRKWGTSFCPAKYLFANLAPRCATWNFDNYIHRISAICIHQLDMQVAIRLGSYQGNSAGYFEPLILLIGARHIFVSLSPRPQPVADIRRFDLMIRRDAAW